MSAAPALAVGFDAHFSSIIDPPPRDLVVHQFI
jgi:hypothetical protein